MKKVVLISVLVVVVIVGVVGYRWYVAVQAEKQRQELMSESIPVAGTLETGPLMEELEDPKGVKNKLLSSGQLLSVNSDKQMADVSQLHNWREVAMELTGEESLREIDDRWLKYTNNKLGFSINVPKKVITSNRCNDDIYQSPLGFFTYKKGKDIVMKLAPFFTYEPVSDVGCSAVQNSVEFVTNVDDRGFLDDSTWHITIANIANDEELNTFANHQYFGGDIDCAVRLLEKQIPAPIGNNGLILPKHTYHVSVGALPLDKRYNYPICGGGYVSVFLYNKTLKKAVQWSMGHDVSFVGKDNGMGYDMDMVKSFKFLQGE